jgi:hypothetical protein
MEMRKRYLTGMQTAYGDMHVGDQADGNAELGRTRIRTVGPARNQREGSIKERNGNATDMRAPRS